MTQSIKINSKTTEINAAPDKPLLWVLREDLGLMGTKYSCGKGLCGACTVHINGVATRSCVTPLASVSGEVTTIEGLSPNHDHLVQQAWIEADAPQCGYCQPGQIMACAALLKSNPKPTDSDIAAAMTNLCRCGTYSRIRKAVAIAAKMLAAGGR